MQRGLLSTLKEDSLQVDCTKSGLELFYAYHQMPGGPSSCVVSTVLRPRSWCFSTWCKGFLQARLKAVGLPSAPLQHRSLCCTHLTAIC